MNTRLFLVLLVTMLLSSPTVLSARARFITIGTGGITGVYYLTGGAIAKMVNRAKGEYGVRAIVESTGGSVFNVNAVVNGDLEFGLVQSNRQRQAVKGTHEWQHKGPQKKLRAVFSLYPEVITLVAGMDTGITSVADLRGKTVNIGNQGSGHRQDSINVLAAAGVDFSKDLTATSHSAASAPRLLQEKKLDAFFYTVGHPNGAIKEASSGARKVRVIPLADIQKLLEQHPSYHKALVPISHYPGVQNQTDVESIGPLATLVTSVAVADEVVYALTKVIFENLENFKKLYPAFSTLTREGMVKGLSAPIHPGALKYYQEAGLL